MRGNAVYTHDTVYKGVPVFRCPYRAGISPRLFFLLIRFRPTLIVSYHPRNYLHFTAYIASRITAARFVIQVVGALHDPFVVRDVDDPMHSRISPLKLLTSFPLCIGAALRGTPSAWKNFILHMPPAHADGLIAMSEDERSLIKEIYGRDSTRIYGPAPQQGVELVQHAPDGSDRLLLGQYLFFIGQVKLRKGWDIAIDAVAELKKKGKEYQLVFVTPHTDVSVPREYAEERGVGDLIHFFSMVTNEERAWLYEHAKYVVIPSRYEGFGLPVFEAFEARKPVCAARIGVFEEFIRDGENALFFESGNAAGLAACIERLDGDPPFANSLIEKGLETQKLFSKGVMVAAYKRYFADLTQNKLM